ncbi:Phospholipid/cholesterol/gamma-HCH transport system substrate-binding protein OS=Streptomyces violarus OX=67380 GN=FHS41_003183 PE=4 SV=1 [Streptomyces violarus]
MGDATTYKARFTDATGLILGDSVRIAGVEVGQVESVRVADRRVAEVTFGVRKGRTLPASVTASIKYLNMVGQRYVDLDRGAGPVGRTFAAGAAIPLSRTTPALDLTQLFNGFQPLFEGLSPPDVNQLAGSIVQVLQGEGGTVDSILRHVGSLTSTVASKDKVIGEVIKNLNTVLKTVNDREAGFDDLVVTLEKLVSGFSGDRKPLGEAVTAMGALTTVTADLFQDGRKPLQGNIRQLGGLSDQLDKGTPQIENFLDKTPAKIGGDQPPHLLRLLAQRLPLRGQGRRGGHRQQLHAPTGIAITQPRCLA